MGYFGVALPFGRAGRTEKVVIAVSVVRFSRLVQILK